MYKANQEALFQATNQQVISIRQSEISYYVNVNNAIGTQAALIGGFTYGIYTQNQADSTHQYTTTMLTVNYIASAITIAASVHVIINTMLLQVLGPGLALNGPVGSMARAAEGMKVEQDQVIKAFTLMMVSFAVATVFSFWAVMDTVAAVVNTIVFAIAARCWIYYSRRVYYRLHWEKQDSWEDQFRGSMSPEPAIATTNPMNNDKNIELNESVGKKDEKKSAGIMSSIFGSKKNKAEAEEEEVDVESLSNKTPFSIAPRNIKGKASNLVIMEGYMAKANFSKSDLSKLHASGKIMWERFYFVLQQNGSLFYYKSRQKYRDEKSAKNERPLALANFYIAAFNSTTDQAGGDRGSGHSIHSILSSQQIDGPLFQIDLVPKDNTEATRWQFRLDTEEELDLWKEAMYESSPTSRQT